MNKSLRSSSSSLSKPEVSINVPSAPVYYPTETEFANPLDYINKIRPEAEPFGLCKIVPPRNWAPPFALDLDRFAFPTKTQEIHRLQSRSAAVDSVTFGLDYDRFLGKKRRVRVVFEGEELSLCALFNAVKRFGGYDRVVREKKWGDVCRVVKGRKVSECAKHVISQLYREHLFDYEEYCRTVRDGEVVERKRRKGNFCGDKVKVKGDRNQICERCKSGLHGDVMLLCDRCDKGWHIYCLSPPLEEIPLGNWYCFECLNSDKDSFGFVPGKRFSVEAFRRIADRAKRKWFGSGPVSRVQIEKKFWEVVEGLLGEVEVMYGSDLDTSVYGSGFPRVNDKKPDTVDVKVWEEYCASPWNLNNLPKLKGSMLRAVNHNITGVMVPWLYIGMLFSAFCWHFEDHCFYSMNYHHWGEPKCWYSIPGSKASAFEKVMQNTLPDLFDAQPDLLFQLVTMLNPSVLQENGVPVYSVLQEPGNFVITFPKSYHGGFNFGLNCAEAVNFAPADWLPYGGFGAELYKLYHRAPVLSHDELLCVVAKSNWDIKVSTYLKEELVKIYTKEKNWRECLWRNGIVKSSPMPPKKCPEYVGTEEDPMCIICSQYLYLSAVVCPCRESAFVCLEHWKHLCECKPSKLRLLYRHSLAELSNFVLNMEYHNVDRGSQSKIVKKITADSDNVGALTKKEICVEGTMAHLAEQWLLCSSKVLQNEFSSKAYRKAIKGAEQFLWGDSDMDPVHTMVNELIEAKNWAECVRACVSRIEDWSFRHDISYEKVDLEYVDKLLIYSPLPCNEHSYSKLKEYAEEAKALIREIESALLANLNMSELELLHFKACKLPIYVKESEKLAHQISSAKVWVKNVRKCLSEKQNGAIHLSFLHRLKTENLELQVHLAETEMFMDLLAQAESYRARCIDLLKSSITLLNAEAFLQDMDGFSVSIPEVEFLRQHYVDAVSWVSHFKHFLVNVHERVDQDSVIDELTGMLKDGKQLRIQVDELALVDVELKKSCCRANALKVLNSLMSLDFVEEVMFQATTLQIETERLFVNINEVLVSAKMWEERAKYVLAKQTELSEFHDLLRSSEGMCVKLPSLVDVQDAVFVAESWLKRAKQFVEIKYSLTKRLSSYLKVDVLKELVFEAKLMKVSLDEQKHLEALLEQCERWELDACSVLQDVECLNNMSTNCGSIDGLVSKIDQLIASIKCITRSGLSLGLYFERIPELRNACSLLQWCNKALSFCSHAPSLEEVEGLMEIGKDIFATSATGAMWGKLLDGIGWLRKAVGVISASSSDKMCELTKAEELLVESQKNKIPFPVVIGQLAEAIEKQKMWQEEARQYFSLQFEDRTSLTLLQLKDVGRTLAFRCSEVERVLFEVQRIKDWSQYGKECLGISTGDLNPLLGALLKVKESLQKSLHICDSFKSCKTRKFCICCSSAPKKQEYLICSLCKDWYHEQCLANTLIDTDATKVYKCHYCLYVESGSISQIRDSPMRFQGKRPDLKSLIELLAASKDLCVGVAQRDALQQLVEQALSFRACLSELLNSASIFLVKDASELEVLSIAVKATELAGVYDCQSSHRLEMSLKRYRWRKRARKLLEGLQKPTIQQIKELHKEGPSVNVPSEDYLIQKLSEAKSHCLRWIDNAKKVSADSGSLGLDKVFELIKEGENLPVNVEKELELLRTRSMLYCICRKPYDQRAMIACDQCDEWYHFDCIDLAYSPEEFICPACQPETEGYPSTSVLADHDQSSSAAFAEPRTPSPRHTKMKRQLKTANSRTVRNAASPADHNSRYRSFRSIEQLCWRNKKPFRRLAKRRSELESLNMFPLKTVYGEIVG